jgi:hypothetical protein
VVIVMWWLMSCVFGYLWFLTFCSWDLFAYAFILLLPLQFLAKRVVFWILMGRTLLIRVRSWCLETSLWMGLKSIW